ncbi:Uncharacterised protein [uncultured archaeon]|nr:Uncharacterised protein [uncultured archaeon]
MAKKKSIKLKKEVKKDDKILFAWLATFLSIIGFVIALIAKRDDKYVMYYAKQSLVIFIIGAILGIIGKIFMIMPIIGNLINVAIGILVFIMWLFSWIYALSGEEKEIPIVSEWAEKINL